MLNYQNIEKQLNKIVDDKIKDIALDTYVTMRQEVPVDTGLLRASVSYMKLKPLNYRIGHRPKFLERIEGVDYGTIVYFGSRGRRPNDWINRTIARIKPKFR